MTGAVKIGGRAVGHDHPVFVIAEAGVSHFGDVNAAFELVDMAVEAKADAVKFQVFNVERMISAESREWRERMGSKALGRPDVQRVADYCRERGITFFATPHEEESADFLESLDVPVFKIGSGELANLPFLRHVARKRRPIILSTGMYSLEDVREAVDVFRQESVDELVLLHCVTAYPTAPHDVNLRAMHALRETFEVPVGYSDHTVGVAIPLAAVAMGACVIEKHIALQKNRPGSQDSLVSCDRSDLGPMVQAIREIEAARGDGVKRPVAAELRSRDWARKSLVATRDIPPGTVLAAEMLCAKRPGTGIAPNLLDQVLGARVRKTIAADTLLRWDDLELRDGAGPRTP